MSKYLFHPIGWAIAMLIGIVLVLLDPHTDTGFVGWIGYGFVCLTLLLALVGIATRKQRKNDRKNRSH